LVPGRTLKTHYKPHTYTHTPTQTNPPHTHTNTKTHPYITKPTHTSYKHSHIVKPTHTRPYSYTLQTHTFTHPHIHTQTATNPHITHTETGTHPHVTHTQTGTHPHITHTQTGTQPHITKQVKQPQYKTHAPQLTILYVERPLSFYVMSEWFSANLVATTKVQFRHSAFHCYVLVVEIKPVGKETAMCRCLVTTVCLKELPSCQMWGADGYEFAVRYIGTDVSLRSVACSAWYICLSANERPWGRMQHYPPKLHYIANHTACNPVLLQ